VDTTPPCNKNGANSHPRFGAWEHVKSQPTSYWKAKGRGRWDVGGGMKGGKDADMAINRNILVSRYCHILLFLERNCEFKSAAQSMGTGILGG